MAINCEGTLQYNSGYGSAKTAYGCRAWMNFQGRNTVFVRASGNLTSLTDYGTGNYGVSFSNSMPDANYSVVCCCREDTAGINNTTNRVAAPRRATSTTSTTSLRIGGTDFGYSASDLESVYIAVFR